MISQSHKTGWQLPPYPIDSQTLSSQHTMSYYHFLVSAIQMHSVHFLSSDISEVKPIFSVVKIKGHNIVKALRDTTIILTICWELSNVVFVGEYQPGGHIWNWQLSMLLDT